MEIKKLTSPDEYYSFQNGRSGMDVSQTNLNLLMGLEPEIDDRILDIGCRSGKIVKTLHDNGYTNTFGMDIGENAEKRWSEHLTELYDGGFLQRGDIHEGIPFEGAFRLVIMSHVIEHLHDLSKCLDTVKEVLTDDGFLFTQVPIQPKERFEKHGPHYLRFDSVEDYSTTIEKEGFEAVFKQEGFVAANPEALVIFKKK